MTLISGYFWTGFIIVWILWAIWTKPTERRESVGSRFSYALLVLVGFYLLLAHHVRVSWLLWPILSQAPRA